MPSTLNPAAHAIKRDAFLDAAERLIRTKGFEQMTVQDLLDDLGASKGAFYHYFASKDALLAAVIERIADAVLAVVEPIAANPDLAPVAQLQAVFSTAGHWKVERSDLLLAMMRTWYAEENDLVRFRLARASAERVVPIVTAIVRRGTADGTFSPTWPDHAAANLVALLAGSGDSIGRLVIDRRESRVTLEEVRRTMAAHGEAVERIVGLPPGSLELIDDATLNAFYA